jgi:hypothetical protein
MSLPTLVNSTTLATAASNTTIATTLTGTSTGNMVVFEFCWQGTGTLTISDNGNTSGGNTYTLLQTYAGTNNNWVSVYLCTSIINPASGSLVITAVLTVASTNTFSAASAWTGTSTYVGVGLLGNINTNQDISWQNNSTTTPTLNVNLLATQHLLIYVANANTAARTYTNNSPWTLFGSDAKSHAAGYLAVNQAAPSQVNASPFTLSGSSIGAMIIIALQFSPSVANIAPVAIGQANGHYQAQGLFCTRQVLDSIGSLASDPAWLLSGMSGVALRVGWNQIQATSSSSFDWSYIDAGFAYGAATGKLVSFDIGAGQYTPAWLFTAGAANFNGNGYAPPWDPIFQQYWLALIQAAAARYGSNVLQPYMMVDGVGFGVSGSSWCLSCADNAAMLAAAIAGGFPTTDFSNTCGAPAGVAIWVNAVTQLAQMYLSAFPNIPLMWVKNIPVYQNIASAYFTALTNLINQFGKKIGLKDNAIKGSYSVTQTMAQDFAFYTAKGYLGGMQRNQPATDPNEWLQSMEIALSLGVSFVEIYPGEETLMGNAQLALTNQQFIQQALQQTPPTYSTVSSGRPSKGYFPFNRR